VIERPVLRHREIESAAAFVRERLGVSEGQPVARVGVVLGSGLGAVADGVCEQSGGKAIEFGAIPHFPTSAVEGHKGRLVYGETGDVPVLLMQGRVHRYEGWAPAEVAFPTRVLLALGVDRLVLTNAAGGIGDGMKAGDLMLISDHLNLTGDSPLVGPNDDRLGPRFPDMSDTYTAALRVLAREVAAAQKLPLCEGVYASVLGPSYETPAEIRMLRALGASAVGMSTVYEAIAASHRGAQVLGLSCITNLAAGMSDEKLSHDEVKETAKRVEAVFADLVLALVPLLGRSGRG
jgi:purine-nucleoside phosphorylase